MFKDQIKRAFSDALDRFLEDVGRIILQYVEPGDEPENDCEGCEGCSSCDDYHKDRSQDILMCTDHGVPIYGTVEEIVDSMPEELERCFSFKDGVIYFGKYTTFTSMKELMDNINTLAKRIRPSRGNLTAPEFRQLMNEWRDNMIDDALQRNNITLTI